MSAQTESVRKRGRNREIANQVVSAVKKQFVKLLWWEVDTSIFRNVRNFLANCADLTHTSHLQSDEKNVIANISLVYY